MSGLEALFRARLDRRDPPRNEPRRRVRFVCLNAGQDVGGQLARKGDNEFVLYESDAANAERTLVEPDVGLIEKAEQHLKDSRDAYLAQNPKDTRLERYRGPTTRSAAFRALNHRAMKPLINWSVGAERLPPPTDEAETRTQQIVVETLKQVLGGRPQAQPQTVALSATPERRKRGRPRKAV